MKCTIKDGKYLAPNGAESILYRDIREKVSEEEANDIFILSKTPTFINTIEKELINNFRNKVIYFPQNIKFKETFINKVRTFHIYNGNNKVGRIQLTPYKEGFKVKSSLVNENERGKGFEKYLYNYAVSRLSTENSILYTDTVRTDSANKVWESLKKQGLTEDLKTVRPLPKEFDENGEIRAEEVFKYIENNFSQVNALTAVEKSHLINLQLPEVETSIDLYNVLYSSFYKNNLFSPDIYKLNKIYNETEIRNILENSSIQGRVKETIEKLRNTEEFNIPLVKINKEFEVTSDKVNIIGQYKQQNALRLEAQYIQENTDKNIQNPVIDLSNYSRVEVVNENGEQISTQLFYKNAIKQPSEKVFKALNTIVDSHPMVDTSKLESSVIGIFKNYGMDIEGLEKEDFSKLLEYVVSPSDISRKSLEEALGFVSETESKVIKGLPKNRTYQYLKTSLSEQELFDELSLIQTSESNVYHKVNKIDEQEMRDIQEVADLTIPDYQLYKDYYGYTKPKLKKETQTNVEGDINYLLNDFIVDFAVEKLKNPIEFNRQFKITSEGIELASNDDITIATVKAYIQDGGKYTKEIADYSLLSKEMPNLKEKSLNFIESKQERKIKAINNIDKVNPFKESITILDEDSLYAPEENAEFLKIDNNVYEMQEQGYYNRIEKNTNPNFFDLNIQQPKFKNFDLKQGESAEIKIKKMISKEVENENFSCL